MLDLFDRRLTLSAWGFCHLHAKRKRGEAPAKPGDEDYPAKDAFKKAAKTAKKEEVELEEKKGSLKQARKNVGADTCWDGYKAKGTKMKNGRSVPNCVKEEDVEEGYGAKKAKKMKKENTFSNWRQEIAEKK